VRDRVAKYRYHDLRSPSCLNFLNCPRPEEVAVRLQRRNKGFFYKGIGRQPLGPAANWEDRPDSNWYPRFTKPDSIQVELRPQMVGVRDSAFPNVPFLAPAFYNLFQHRCKSCAKSITFCCSPRLQKARSKAGRDGAFPTQARFWLEWGYLDPLNSVIPTGGWPTSPA
jgi:hypothetical protein